MKKKIIYFFIFLIVLVIIYIVIFQKKTVTYSGEDQDWYVQIDSKLEGLTGSYSIEVQYKGKEKIDHVNFNIHPRYEVGLPFLDEKGHFYRECYDCGFYYKESKLLFFIVWKGEDSEEKMRFIELRKE